MQPQAAHNGDRLRHSVTHRLPISIRRVPFRTADKLAAIADRRRLRSAHPRVAASLDARRDVRELRTEYDRYVNEVSNWEWAVSWPTTRALDALCAELRPRRILDLGSGFSTYVVCRWAAASGQDVEVVSADDSPDWLAKTRSFLESHGLDAHLIDVTELDSLPDHAFDLAFDDLGRTEDRARLISPIVRLLAPGGVVVLDDMNVRGYRREVRSALNAAKWPLYSVREQTLDAKGRFAMLTVAPQ
jgi:predicted O-methyltransferase YrrM